MHIRFSKNGVRREVKVGYSWTVGLFGPITYAIRGLWGWAFLALFLGIITYGLSSIVLGFFANKQTARHLAENGWRVIPWKGNGSSEVPASWGIEQ